jgi:hypothetical protein
MDDIFAPIQDIFPYPTKLQHFFEKTSILGCQFSGICGLFFEVEAQVAEQTFGVGADVDAGVEGVFIDENNAGAEHYGYIVVEIHHGVNAVHVDGAEGRMIVHVAEHHVAAVEIHGRGVESVTGQQRKISISNVSGLVAISTIEVVNVLCRNHIVFSVFLGEIERLDNRSG